jgi:hypothetical protein
MDEQETKTNRLEIHDRRLLTSRCVKASFKQGDTKLLGIKQYEMIFRSLYPMSYSQK